MTFHAHPNLAVLKARIAVSMDFTAPEREFLLDAVNRRHAAVLYTPSNRRIEAVWAFISVGKHGEGLCMIPTGVGTMPISLVAADQAQLEDLRLTARAMANVFREPIRLVRFASRAELEVIEPVLKND